MSSVLYAAHFYIPHKSDTTGNRKQHSFVTLHGTNAPLWRNRVFKNCKIRYFCRILHKCLTKSIKNYGKYCRF